MPNAPVARIRAMPSERGLTLIELMVAVVISGLVVGFVLGINTRLGSAYHTQAHLAETQTALNNTANMLVRELRVAGYRIPNGFQTTIWGNPLVKVPAFQVWNDAANVPNLTDPAPAAGFGSDTFRLYYGDPGTRARVVSLAATGVQLEPGGGARFAVGDFLFLSRPVLATPAGGGPKVHLFEACLVRVASKSTDLLTFSLTAPYGGTTSPQCGSVISGAAADTEVLLAVARGFRINPDAADLPAGVLQMCRLFTGCTDAEWEDMALGFATIQLASRYFEDDAIGTVTDVDGDTDPERNWYSGANQQTPDPDATRPAFGDLTSVSISLEARTRASSSVGSIEAANLAGADVDFNDIGDRPEFALPALAPYQGAHAYRSTRTLVEMRNIGLNR